jgi:GT2 family glycosyltransferase
MIAILSVCLNDEAKLPLFLENMATWSCRNYEYYLIDNGSTDRSLALVEASGMATKIIRLPSNLSTTGGYNEGIRHALAAGAEYIMFLALDALLAPDVLERLRTALEVSPELGVVAPSLYFSHDPTRVETMGFALDRSNWRWRTLLHGPPGSSSAPGIFEVDYVDGGTSFYRAAAIQRIGGFDEQIFMYGDDQDMCLRLQLAGYKVATVTTAHAWHRHVELNRGIMYSRPYEIFYLHRNTVYLMRKHAASVRRGAYLRALWRECMLQPAYFLIRQRSLRQACICLEGVVHGLLGRMGKTKYVR